MSVINIENLTFGYENATTNVFDDVSLHIDTDWKLGLIGRNGTGKTTLLKLLIGEYEYKGNISSPKEFDYFPYQVNDNNTCACELIHMWKKNIEDWQVISEMSQLELDGGMLYRPFDSLSSGERTKIMLATLFSGENEFLLIDEPTNHLDIAARESVKNYLLTKKGFILVSHDRDLLDACVNHVLVINKASIIIQQGNFSSWSLNKEKEDQNAQAENNKHKKEIRKLYESADKVSRWADKNENTKIGFDPIKEHDRFKGTRSYIGGKTKKMEARVKSFEERKKREIAAKQGLLKDIETDVNLQINPLKHYKRELVSVSDFNLRYNDADNELFNKLEFTLNQGDRLFINGTNGSGKSTLIKYLLRAVDIKNGTSIFEETYNGVIDVTSTGDFNVVPNLIISYINQDTSHLKGKLCSYAEGRNIDYSLLIALLRQLDLNRYELDKDMRYYSEGQKKKVIIAASLLTPAHLYVWDEPFNYIDVLSRTQIERMILKYKPTMLIVEHDKKFMENVSTKIINLSHAS